MGITRPLPQAVLVLDPNGRKFDQVNQYAWKPMYCGTCYQLGDDCARDRPRQAETEQKQQAWETNQNVPQGGGQKPTHQGVVQKHKRQLVSNKQGPLKFRQVWQVAKEDPLYGETGSSHIHFGEDRLEDEWHTTKRRSATKGTSTSKLDTIPPVMVLRSYHPSWP